MNKVRIILLTLVWAVALLPLTASASITVFSWDFEGSVPTQLSGVVTTESVQGFAGLGPAGNQFGGNFLRNTTSGNPASATILTLTGLPAHDKIDIAFLFAAIDSWDSTDGTIKPDYFNVMVDGTVIFQPTFANASGTVTYPNGQLGSPNLDHRGFNGSWQDRGFDMGDPSVTELRNIPHTADTVIIQFFASGAGWQGGGDESWGMDNLKIQVSSSTVVPLPGSILLLGFGLARLLGGRQLKS